MIEIKFNFFSNSFNDIYLITKNLKKINKISKNSISYYFDVGKKEIILTFEYSKKFPKKIHDGIFLFISRENEITIIPYIKHLKNYDTFFILYNNNNLLLSGTLDYFNKNNNVEIEINNEVNFSLIFNFIVNTFKKKYEKKKHKLEIQMQYYLYFIVFFTIFLIFFVLYQIF
jgi:hypothetical protein